MQEAGSGPVQKLNNSNSNKEKETEVGLNCSYRKWNSVQCNSDKFYLFPCLSLDLGIKCIMNLIYTNPVFLL